MRSVVIILFVLLGISCSRQQNLELSNRDITTVIDTMTDIMVHDVTNPPLAARFFSYALLSAYEIVSENEKKYPSMYGRLNNYPELSIIPVAESNYRLSALLAMMETAKKIQPSGARMAAYQQQYIDSLKDVGFDEEMIDSSLSYAKKVSTAILAYAKADGYNKISTMSRYTPSKKEGSWYPTPPGFFAAVEPFFNKVRPFTLDSASQFKPAVPEPFATGKQSGFYKMVEAVYSEGKNADPKHQEIAAFWDCNPFNLDDNGHLQYAHKKISPGAHWLGITGIACEKAKKDFNQSIQIHTVVAIGLMDGFMACWDEKFRSNRIRPETAIRKMIDPSWAPLLQTPPFPEYLSGHSTISFTSATILTSFFGENFKYTDSVEVPYGLPPRSFNSFMEAAEEAGISRFYGGIHFMDAITNGSQQGKLVGQWVLNRLTHDTK